MLTTLLQQVVAVMDPGGFGCSPARMGYTETKTCWAGAKLKFFHLLSRKL